MSFGNLYDHLVIVSRDNPKLKELRRVKRSCSARTLLEGPHLIREALSAAIQLESILATPDFMKRSAATGLLEVLPFFPILVEEKLLEEIADSDTPRGIVALARIDRGGIESIKWSADSVFIYVDGIQDPGNLGALARVAEATSVAGLVLSPTTVHPNHPRALRASAGSLLRVPVATEILPDELTASIPPRLNADWIGLTPRHGEALHEARLESPLILALGAEGSGLSDNTLGYITRELSIPMQAPVESLNVTVSAAVVMYELVRRGFRQPTPRGR